ncbi:Holliday junction branch migration protein RuvA [Adlercreutzia sp. ZJ304]|uniref:Holliday junction branch migration protein RuvA n=1 Tax=Adlercreutzia sp. ZJ304 TaxID=2709791 RepID=UPI0013EDA224|nr:Holliday junction branch migration protein RuvA [Adlercreutzia sp. ZJ304]
MIAFLNGQLAGKLLNSAFIDVGGIGYEVFMSQTALSKLPEIGSSVYVRTYMHVSDNGITLYGFLADDEKAMFEKLIGVSGVGPKVALAALSTFSSRKLADAVAAQDSALVSKIPGVGKKTAQRIILELKGSLDDFSGSLFNQDDSGSVVDQRMSGAVEALLSMGFTSSEIELAMNGAPEGATESSLVKYALKRLGS